MPDPSAGPLIDGQVYRLPNGETVRAEVAWMLHPTDQNARHYYGVLEHDQIVKIDRDTSAGDIEVVDGSARFNPARLNTAWTLNDLKPDQPSRGQPP
jgi:hypothetical protein